ncbi:4-hydroxy-tetrahydrodipicolinate reductase [Gorillibacterium sp. sgz5001074]|uniref:4-hydroxy-tetrahydrodipicolinate reductase n=1 Tax=Gorillibacterium sp. sgz5001074 TaxID=3446695 RepID=UPI003F663816
MIRAAVIGGTGKLGRDILAVLEGDGEMEAAAVVARKGNPYVGRDLAVLTGGRETGRLITDDIRDTFGACDVYIDCTCAEAFLEHVAAYREAGKPLVLATTGFCGEGESRIRELAGHVPVVLAPNLSAGVVRFLKLVRLAARLMEEETDIDILESHHKGKRDRPSGTAKRLREIILEERRQAGSQERDIPVHSIRAGGIVGEHTVQFVSGENERINLSHSIESRTAFARGAVQAAGWAVGRDHGLYGPEDIFG